MENSPTYNSFGSAVRALYQAHTVNRARFHAMRRVIGYRGAVASVWTNPYWGS
jgi:hypothetical protein